ncbi:MAG: putative metalloprotease with PDZ domain [Cyclobacteriaceae bacterium]|jgi:predicted metalloprotease with PDZ domain
MQKVNFFKFKKTFLLFNCIVILFTISCHDEEIKVHRPPDNISLSQSIYYYINLNDQSGDSFKVKGYLQDMDISNGIFQFPVVVPGTYSISDIGRFVTKFEAYNAQDELIATEHISTNQWQIADPASTYYVKYEILETWDNPQEGDGVYRMEGTSIENDHVLINTGAVLGYPTGLKNRTYYLELDYPKNWIVGTSMENTSDQIYRAKNYDYLVDSPLLIGRLSNSSITIDQAEIGVYAYSKTNMIPASTLQSEIESVLYDASAFLIQLPVDRYNFLFHFEEFSSGALEHSFSSVYVLRERELTENFKSTIKNISAHEFFHIVTPLNIHSEIIKNFNFVDPTPSAHLWLYEGVTEWASHMMQYRNGSKTLDQLFSSLKTKYTDYTGRDNTLSLEQLSLTSFTEEGGKQFGGVYTKGALLAYLLDIRLLELSGGSDGLRELILELIDIYGEDQAFDDQTFFSKLENLTDPEIGDFINAYIIGTDAFPIQEYFAKIGIDFNEEQSTFSLIQAPTAVQQNLFNQWKVNL